MKKSVALLCAVAVLTSGSSLCHAAPKCTAEKISFDRSVMDYNRADQTLNRLQQQADSRFEQGEYRRAMLEANVEAARGNVKAAQQGGVGQGISCLLSPRPDCVGSSVSRTIQQVARAKAMLRAQEGRLRAFMTAHNQMMTRLSERVTKQEALVAQRKSAMVTKEAGYLACMAK